MKTYYARVFTAHTSSIFVRLLAYSVADARAKARRSNPTATRIEVTA